MPSPLAGRSPAASELFDIQTVAAAVMRSSALTETSFDGSDGSATFVDAGDADLLIREDISGPVLIKGKGSVLIEGDLIGEPGAPCRIEVTGDAVVTGEVSHATVTAERVFVKSDVSEVHFTAGETVRIGGNLTASRLTLGSYDENRRRIDRCGVVIERSKESAEGISRRVDHEEKRMDKACRALRVPLDFNVGNVVQHTEGRVRVDLTNFYRSVEDKEARPEIALAEFFAKGVVGVVARTNRKYLLNYPAHEKVFMQLLKSLRELLEIVMERDRLLEEVSTSRAELQDLISDLAQRQPTVAIRGRVAPDLEIEFILPQSIPLTGGGYDFAHKSAGLQAHQSSLPGQLDFITRTASGERRNVLPSDVPDLRGIQLFVRDGHIRWDNINTMEMQHA